MNPKPFFSLNHFTVPVLTTVLLWPVTAVNSVSRLIFLMENILERRENMLHLYLLYGKSGPAFNKNKKNIFRARLRDGFVAVKFFSASF